MVNNKAKLQDFVRRVIDDKNLTYRDVADRSNKLISHSTVYDIISGRNLNPSPKVLRGLAKGLGVTEEEIFSLVRNKAPNTDVQSQEKFELLSLKFNELKGTNKAKAEVLIEVLERELERMASESG